MIPGSRWYPRLSAPKTSGLSSTIPEVVVERVFYCAGSSFVTGDDIAEALLEYAQWVVLRGQADVVHVPTRGEDGSAGRATLLLTSSTQLSAEAVRSVGREMADADLVLQLRGKTDLLRSPQPAVAETRILEELFDL